MAVTGKGAFPLVSAWLTRKKKGSLAPFVKTDQNDTEVVIFNDWLFSASSSASGSISWTEDNDVFAITGTAAAGTVSGTVSWTEDNDTCSITGGVTASGALAWTETDDAYSITGMAGAAGSASGTIDWTEADDSASITGNVIPTSSGSIGWTESDDVTAITGSVVTSATGSISWTEDSDVFALTGRAPDEQSYNVYGLRAQFKRQESDEQKRIRREAQGIIKKIKKLDPEEPEDELLADAENVAQQIKEVIARLEANARELEGMKATKAQEKALRALLIDAQIEHEMMVQQQTDLDVAFVAVMLAELF